MYEPIYCTSKAIDRIKPGYVCAEVGVWKGRLSEHILWRQPSKLHLIDPWAHQDFPVNDPSKLRIYCCGQEEMDKIYNGVVNKFSEVGSVEIHRKFSVDVSFPKGYFDWVYIDANHSYENVLEDLRHYKPFVRPGGFLCGDDYGANESDPYSNGGPERAVKEFIEETGFEAKVNIKASQFIIEVQ